MKRYKISVICRMERHMRFYKEEIVAMNKLKVGFSTVNVAPPLGIPIQGYFIPRFAKGFLDDPVVSVLVLETDEKRIAMVSVPVCTIYKELSDPWLENLEEATGISKKNVFLSATHTHTGGGIRPDDKGEKAEQMITAYRNFMGERIVDAVTLAIADLKPARMGYITGYAPERVAYIRRYKMKDGSTFTCPPINDPNIDYAIGQLDQRVHVLRFDQECGDTIVLVNYGLHADTINGEMISGDWPVWMAKTLDKALDGVKTIFFNGAEGDVGSTNVHPTGGDMNDTEISFDNEMKSPGMARFVGRALAGTVLQVFDKVCYVDVEDMDITEKLIEIPSNMPRPEDMPLAKKYKQLHDEGRDDEIPYTAMQLTTVVAEAIRMCQLENGPESFTMNLTGLRIGPVALVGIPGEPFTEIGVEIKKAKGWDLIMPCCLTNGAMGYFPMMSAYDEGGYEAKTSRFKAGVAEIIIDKAKEMLNEMKEKSR